ncbi:hypothetical protein AUO94_04090 [Planococcus kocurii]|uniref:Uncharacterized protein n=1 Tax=Planococcus kocurii TaxID=1374 RepID=A0ABM5WU57_9BACL|nr:hypothetical protein AUO94_04090 [Planococcus kocurii]
MAQVVLFFVSSGTEIWQRWYYSRAINTGLVLPRFSLFTGQQTRQVWDKKNRQFLVKIKRQ